VMICIDVLCTEDKSEGGNRRVGRNQRSVQGSNLDKSLLESREGAMVWWKSDIWCGLYCKMKQMASQHEWFYAGPLSLCLERARAVPHLKMAGFKHISSQIDLWLTPDQRTTLSDKVSDETIWKSDAF